MALKLRNVTSGTALKLAKEEEGQNVATGRERSAFFLMYSLETPT